MKQRYIEFFILAIIILVCCGILSYSAYSAGKRATYRDSIKKEIKDSEKKEKPILDSLNILKQKYISLNKTNKKLELNYNFLKNNNEKLELGYNTLKEQNNKKIDKERIDKYTDPDCLEDVISLKSQIDKANDLLVKKNKAIELADSLMNGHEYLLFNLNDQVKQFEKLVQEKDTQIDLYKNQKPKIKPIGIGLIGGYGTNFKDGLTPYIGVGISYNIIRL